MLAWLNRSRKEEDVVEFDGGHVAEKRCKHGDSELKFAQKYVLATYVYTEIGRNNTLPIFLFGFGRENGD